MPDETYNVSSSSLSRPRVRLVRRLVLGLFAVLVLAFQYVGYQVDRGIRGYYFHDYSLPKLGVVDVVVALVATYLLLVAVFGRWRLFFKAR